MIVFKFLGKEGRTTIPFPIRTKLGWKRGDLVSFTEQEDGSVVLRREFLCDSCEEFIPDTHDKSIEKEELTLQDCLDSLSEKTQRDVLVYLMTKWAAKEAGIGR